MDPRKPELALARVKELITQYDRIEADMEQARTSSDLSKLEREGGLVVQELCLTAPRMHEAMIQTSRRRRHALAHGLVVEANDQIIAINEATTEEAEIVEKPKKKTTRKKKTTKKADK